MRDYLEHELKVGETVVMVGGDINWFNLGVVKSIGKAKVTVEYDVDDRKAIAIRFPEQLIVVEEEERIL